MEKQPAGIREFVRKKLVSLKRRPQIIPLLVLAAAFVLYSLNLRKISDTTAKIMSQGMGLAGFATMLFSILSLVSFLNAFPHRKKVKVPMLVLMFVMLGIILYCDIFYSGCITNAIYREKDPIRTAGNEYILEALSMLKTHKIVVAVGAGLTALLPVYKPLLKKINTSVEVEANEGIGEIDISGEDA